ncbi:hypothetical protein FA13DRAFT_1829913 [Coprinellus micaceus]|uniref:Uncharacterized protein n=1 Tax=Coprinellus micaceus TaxID=71717 RepID=A0A4Y7SIH0_COPMI|nr:hypothetical protein FA13DRAFT_1829913 [Coprinellus micaceus]
MTRHTLPVEILFAILETLRDHGDVRTLERCRSAAPGEGQRIRQFIDKLSSTGFAERMRRLSLTTNVEGQESGGSITRRLNFILKKRTKLNYLELEMHPAAFDFIPGTSMWAIPSEPDGPMDYVTSKLHTLELKGFQPFKFFKPLIEGLSGKLSGHKNIKDDVGSAQNLVDLFKRKRNSFVHITAFMLGAGCDMFLMALDMMLPDLNLFPSADVFACSPESPNAVASAFAVARGMGDTLTSFKWRSLNAMPGTHDTIFDPVSISLAALPNLTHVNLPIVVRDAGMTSKYLSSDDVLSILEAIPTNNSIKSMEFTYHFFNTEHLLYGRAWDHRNELIPYFRTEKSSIIGPQVNRLYNIALARKRLFPALKKIEMKVFAPFQSEDMLNPAARYKMVPQAWSNLVFRLVHNHEFELFIESIIRTSVAPLSKSGVEVGVQVEKWVPS